MNEVKGIYLIERITVDSDSCQKKYYVGMAKDIFGRLAQHCNNHIQDIDKEINKLGVDKFRFQILEKVSRISDLKRRETEWIERYKEKYGECSMYNISETQNRSLYSIDTEIKKKVEKLLNEDIGRSIYAIADFFNISWEEVVNIRKPLLKHKGLKYDMRTKKVIEISTKKEPDNWRGAMITKKMADKILQKVKSEGVKNLDTAYTSKADLMLFLELNEKGTYKYAPDLIV